MSTREDAPCYARIAVDRTARRQRLILSAGAFRELGEPRHLRLGFMAPQRLLVMEAAEPGMETVPVQPNTMRAGGVVTISRFWRLHALPDHQGRLERWFELQPGIYAAGPIPREVAQ